MKITKEKMKEFLNSFSKAIEAEQNKRQKDTIQFLLKVLEGNIDENKLDYTNPKIFRLFLVKEIDGVLETLLKQLLKEKYGKLSEKQLSILEFLYTKYNFIMRQLDGIFYTIEGMDCCHDKAVKVFNVYLDYVATGEFKEFDYTTDKLLPEKVLKTKDEIVTFFELLYRYYWSGISGFYTKYFEFVQGLLNKH